MLLVAWLADLPSLLSFDMVRENYDLMSLWVADHLFLASLAYIAVYAVVTALSVPGAAVLTVTAGLLFGVVIGTVIVATGATLGALSIFLLARTAFGDFLKARVGNWLDRLAAGFQKDAFSYMLSLRLVPVFPFWLVNLAPAFLGCPLKTYAITTVLGILPATIVFVSIGNGLGAAFAAGENPDLGMVFDPVFLLPLLGLAALSLLPVVWQKVSGRMNAPLDAGSIDHSTDEVREKE